MILHQLILCLVVAVTDGDTLRVSCKTDGGNEKVVIRLAEIDAPEMKQPFGAAAKQALAKLCDSQQAWVLPLSKDRYGRTVAHVECAGKWASDSQVERGYAWVYTKYSLDQALLAREQKARDARLGLWVQEDPVEPWIWRRNRAR